MRQMSLQVRGYLPATGDGAASNLMEGAIEEETMRELQQRKQEMLIAA